MVFVFFPRMLVLFLPSSLLITVEPLNGGHIGTSHFVHYNHWVCYGKGPLLLVVGRYVVCVSQSACFPANLYLKVITPIVCWSAVWISKVCVLSLGFYVFPKCSFSLSQDGDPKVCLSVFRIGWVFGVLSWSFSDHVVLSDD